MKIVLMLIILAFISSCSTAKIDRNSTKQYEISMPSFQNDSLEKLQFDGTFQTKSPMGSLSFTGEITIYKREVIAINIMGPFGIMVGRLYADTSQFKFYNIFENTIYIGKPTDENIYRSSGIYLSMKDLISFLRNEIPYSNLDFTLDSSYKQKLNQLFKRVDKRNFADFVLFNSDLNLLEYQRKDNENNSIIRVSYSDYKLNNNFKLAHSVNIVLPKNDFSLKYDINTLKINIDTTLPKNFDIPEKVKIIDLDKIE